MSNLDLSVAELLAAARQLPDEDRIFLISELMGPPKGAEARKKLEQLRDQFSMDPKRQRRMSVLLAKGKETNLTPSERLELDALVDEFQQRSLELAQAVSRSGHSIDRSRRKGRQD